nr:MAG TPA: hypothetical protein [Caudoviricetes sp.]
MIQTRQESRQGLLLLIVPAGAHILRKLLPGSVIGADFPQGTFGADLFLLGIIVVFIDVFAVDAVDFISGGIRVKIIAAARTGFHRFTPPPFFFAPS